MVNCKDCRNRIGARCHVEHPRTVTDTGRPFWPPVSEDDCCAEGITEEEFQKQVDPIEALTNMLAENIAINKQAAEQENKIRKYRLVQHIMAQVMERRNMEKVLGTEAVEAVMRDAEAEVDKL